MKKVLFCAIAIILLGSCSAKNNVTTLHVEGETVVTQWGDTIRLGGYGSSMAYDKRNKLFYLLTDRGPNTDYGDNEAKMFPMPNYSPTVGVFSRLGDSLKLLRKIQLKDSLGRAMLGLPNTNGDGVTGEIAYNPRGERITDNYQGIDSEGLALAPDSTLWISDEYAPFVMNFTLEGELLRTLSPGKGLPAYYAKRRPNRGMEGLTISADGTKLYGIMQSPLYLPDSSTRNNSRNNRIIEISLIDGSTREFIYELENPRNIVSEITFLDEKNLLVLERDGKFPKDGKGFKRIYSVDINRASDVSGKIIENMSPKELSQNAITIAPKRLYIDILKEIPHYPHDKVEGIAILDNGKVAVVNDDDFSITDEDNTFVPKLQPSGNVDRSTVYIITPRK